MNIFEEYKLAVESHNSLNSQLQSLFEQLAEAKTLYILPLTKQIEKVQDEINTAIEIYNSRQEALHDAIMNGNVQISGMVH